MRARSRLPLVLLTAASAALACATPAAAGGVTPKVGTPFVYEGLVRAGGLDRYETAAIVSRGSFAPSPGGAVFVTDGTAAADALAAGPAAASLDAPLLLSAPGELPRATAAELERLQPVAVYVIGGADRVSDGVLAEIQATLPAASVTRVAGADRYATAVAVAERFFPDADSAVITRGDTFPDALSGGAAAASAGVPLLLTQPTALAGDTETWLAVNAPGDALIVGGPAAVSADVEARIARYVTDPAAVTRLGGADRYATSAAVAAALFRESTTAFLATGEDFPDALAGVPAAAVNGAPLLLLPRRCTPQVVTEWVEDLPITGVVVLGGEAAVPDTALTATCP